MMVPFGCAENRRVGGEPGVHRAFCPFIGFGQARIGAGSLADWSCDDRAEAKLFRALNRMRHSGFIARKARLVYLCISALHGLAPGGGVGI